MDSSASSREDHGVSSTAPSFSAARDASANKALKILRFGELEAMYRVVAQAGRGEKFFAAMVDVLKVDLTIQEAALKRIPASGPLVVVANHPFGLLEGAALMSRLLKVRPDAKVMANSILATVPEVADWFISVDPFGGAESKLANQRGLRQCIEWLKKGGCLVVYPAGEVSHFQPKKWQVTDPEWSPTIGRIIRRAGAPVVPAFTLGANSMLFQFAGMLHPKLRTALLPHEYLNKKERPVEIRIGGVIPAARVADASSDEALMRYLRWRTYLLAYKPRLRRTRRPAAAAGARPNISGEVEALGPDRCLAKAGDLEVYCAQAREIPRLLDEIGDLREITFRAVGEGTGRSRDLDEFDSFYLHLFSWDTKRKEVAGAYRLGLTDEILRARGIRGLYTSTQFRYGQDFVREIQPAIELGRSFIRQEYQRSFSSLLLLWKGIGRFIVDQPRYRFLFGPVSISNDYSQLSRKLLTEYLERNLLDERLSRMVKPRKPFRKFLVPKEAAWSADLEEFSEIIADLEPDGKGVPVLLRQYLKLGGKILGFNVDPKFSQTLDGLIVVDLCLTDRTMLNRYMGSDGASRFLHHHKRLVA